MNRALLIAVSILALGTATAADLKVRIPASPNILPSQSILSPYRLESKQWGSKAHQEKIIFTDAGGTLHVHRRDDNGTAGSGLKYEVNVTSSPVDGATELGFTQTGAPHEYREGLVLRFPVPSFTDQDLIAALASGSIGFQWERNTEFPVESIAANFARLANGQPARGNNYNGLIEVGGSPVSFVYRIVPYRNGSKVLVNASLTQEAVVNGVIDFAPLVVGFEDALTAVVDA